MSKTLYLVDASSIFFRSYYAVPFMSRSDGFPTNVLYGYVSTMIKILKDYEPKHIAFCFDHKEPSFRSEIYEDYKANRDEAPDDLAQQIPYIHDFTKAFGFSIFQKKGYEADDLIATLSSFALKKSFDICILSGDKDFAQLICPQVKMIDLMRGVVYDEKKVFEKWGVKPSQMQDYLSIVGDSSDNIPGVKGIGTKGAAELLGKYGNLENIYKKLDKVKPSHKQKLIDSKEKAFMSQKLVALEDKVELKLVKTTEKNFKPSPLNRKACGKLFDEFEFSSFKKNLLGVSEKKKSQNLKILETDCLKAFDGGKKAFLLTHEDQLFVCIGINIYPLKTSDIEKLLKSKSSVVAFDLKGLLRRWDSKSFPSHYEDVSLMAYSYKTSLNSSFENLVQKMLGTTVPQFPLVDLQFENLIDLYKTCKSKLSAGSQELKNYEVFEKPLAKVLFQMERRGVCVCEKKLKKMSLDLARDIEKLENVIYEESSHEFNLSSPKQVGQVLFEEMNLPVIKKTKTGYSTDVKVLQKLATEHPICEMILEHRELSKLKSTYVDALPRSINVKTKRIHTHLNQSLTSTGRLSSQNPNLQNIPIRKKRGQLIRSAFIPNKTNLFVSVDYSQMELRILAHMSQDKNLISFFNQDLDVHAMTASTLYGVPVSEVSSIERGVAKSVNFGLVYGQTAFGLSENLQFSKNRAENIIKNYFKLFPGVKKYMDAAAEVVESQGYVKTLSGRRIYVEAAGSSSSVQRKMAHRVAINAPIQGTSSEIIKLAMINIEKNVPLPMLLQVHDELLFEGTSKEIQKHLPTIVDIMDNAINLDVPLKVQVAEGTDWQKTHN